MGAEWFLHVSVVYFYDPDWELRPSNMRKDLDTYASLGKDQNSRFKV